MERLFLLIPLNQSNSKSCLRREGYIGGKSMSVSPASLSKQRKKASEQKSMGFFILQQSGADEGGLGKVGEEK